jgi:O-methyltransferase involved in polyketide biosynthesis
VSQPAFGAAGYYARVAAIRQLVLRFLAAGGDAERAPPAKQARRCRVAVSHQLSKRSRSLHPHQVVSLGAGFDTLFFSLVAAGVAPARYVEVDFAEARRPLRRPAFALVR